ncbi:hypothetical protein J3459_012471 [Metarhizium acridum]|uniref:uncharacterized protein n=1 Tax=Metarhizium acridum TaxID=92637 RepID=UPI001C6B31F6|nr:hypothetical protein J3458_012298 [Metarhizium acridum]KAG8417267.1 hypothetical protein J3459_012471 [Metarhizium acridum]
MAHYMAETELFNIDLEVVDLLRDMSHEDLRSFAAMEEHRMNNSEMSQRRLSMDDLNRAVDVVNMAVDATPKDHPDRAGRLNILGINLVRRFDRTGSMDDLNCALLCFKQGWACHTAPPSIRIHQARKAARIFASQLDWEQASTLLQHAVDLLPTVSPRSLQHTDKQHMLADSAGLASMAAATALNAGKDPYYALQSLELGRAVIADTPLSTPRPSISRRY